MKLCIHLQETKKLNILEQWSRLHGARGARAPTFTNG